MAETTQTSPKKKKIKKQGNYVALWKRFRSNKVAMVSLSFLLLLIIMALTIGLFMPYSKAIKMDYNHRKELPSWDHIFGTDMEGRDIFARIMYGAQYTLAIGFGASLLCSVCGALLGSLSGYFGGWFDILFMRIVEIITSIPNTMLVLALVTSFGRGIFQILIGMTLGQIFSFSRLIRSSALSVASLDYVESSRAMGAGHWHIIRKHIIPNVMSTVIIQGTIAISGNIMMATTLGYLGVGIPAPRPEWGAMMQSGFAQMRFFPHLVLIPAAWIVTTSVAANLCGDGVRDAFDPKLKGLKGGKKAAAQLGKTKGKKVAPAS